MKNFILHFILFLTLTSFVLLAFYVLGKNIWYPYYEKCFMQRDVQPIQCEKCHEPLKPLECEPIVTTLPCEEQPTAPKLTFKQRTKHILADNDFIIYPKNLTLIALKNEKILEVWTERNGSKVHLISYPFTAFSGRLGPKFKEGDRQIPEGIYGISYLNPNSKFHLSMRVNYPNAFDKRMAKKENRKNLGGDIMIHGSDRTIGCVPIGDDNIEELYFLAEQVGIENIKVILSPIDFRLTDVKIKTNKHPWMKDLYTNIKKEMQPFTSK